MITNPTNYFRGRSTRTFDCPGGKVEVDICEGTMYRQKNMLGWNSSRCFTSSATEHAVTGDQRVEAKVGLVHGDGFIWRKQLLGQRQPNFDVVS